MTLPSTQPRPAPSPVDVGLTEDPPAITESASLIDITRARIDRQIRAMLEHQDGSRTGEDPEDLHQFRVAIRRLRSVLKNAPALRSHSANARTELGWLADLTSPIRDLDVMLLRIADELAAFGPADEDAAQPLVEALETERDEKRVPLVEALDSDRYTALVNELATLVTEEPLPDGASAIAELSGTKLVGSLNRPYHKLAKAVHKLPADPPDDDLHDLRIYGKRLRYAAETALPSAGKDHRGQLKDIVKHCKELQDVLGDHQDAVVAATKIRTIAEHVTDPRAAFVAGRLVEREFARRAEVRAQWSGVWHHIEDTASALL